MKMVGIYQIALLPDADEDAFVSHMTGEDFGAVEGVLQLTRITSGFQHQLLKRSDRADLRHYGWHVTALLVGDRGYSFEQNVERLQAGIQKFGLVTGVDTYAVVAEQGADSG